MSIHFLDNKKRSYTTLVVTFVVLISFFSARSSYSQNVVSDEVERAALLALYNSTNGAAWNLSKDNKWTLTKIAAYPNPDSTLYGLEVENGDVVAMTLNSTGLNGNLPLELNNLTELTILSLRGNSLSGTLPYLGNLTKLTLLDFYLNDFSGTFPQWLANLVNLRTLTLTSNPNNPAKFNGVLPSQISNLIQLTNLDLSYNDLSANEAIPASFSALDNLTTLQLINVGLLPASVSTGLSGLAKLNTLYLSINQSFVESDGTLPNVLYDLPALRNLFLTSINFSKLPGQFDELNQLNYLSLSNNNYADTTKLKSVLDGLKSLSMLQTLVLIDCNIIALPYNIRDLSTLTGLYLGSNNQLDPVKCEFLSEMPRLESLYLYGCNLTSLPSTLINLTTLKRLDVQLNKLYPIPELIKDIPNLEYLNLQNNKIGTLPAWFGSGNMDSLTDLRLGYNNITLPLPDNFKELTNLKTLFLSNNSLEGSLPSFFSDLTNILYLDISFNKLTSPFPDLSNWNSLTTLYAQYNNFTDSLPSYLSTKPLSTASLSYNSFNAFTPFTNHSNLYLSLNHNKLTFADITQQTSFIQSFIYNSQDSVDVTKLVKLAPGDTLKLTAEVDRNTTPASHYQWFKKVNNTITAITASPSAEGHTLIIPNVVAADSGYYFYRITNPSFTGLTLNSRFQRLKMLPCDSITNQLSFDAQKYVCAFLYKPAVQRCTPVEYLWDFGDGSTSTEKEPLHAFQTSGTYSVTLKVGFRCGTCDIKYDSIKQDVYFDNSDPDIFRDTVINVSTDLRTKILSTSASTFSDAWPLQHTNESLNTTNAFLNGSFGVWRNDASYLYKVDRSQSADVKLNEDGAFAMETFNWSQAELAAIPNWIKSTTITEYSPYSYELENKSVLGIYSAALYDYGGHLPSANGNNMRNNEMAFTSFEYLDGNATGNWVFGNTPLPAYHLFNVKIGMKNTAIVEASLDQLKNVQKVDVTSRFLYGLFRRNYNFLKDVEIVCRQQHPVHPEWSVIVLRKSPFDGVWMGRLKAYNVVNPLTPPLLDHTYAHSGKSSIKSSTGNEPVFKQDLIQLDSGKTYLISAWVSINNQQVVKPTLGEDLGIHLAFRNDDNVLVGTNTFKPVGNIIEGWQQVKGVFTCPGNNLKLEIQFKAGETGQAWYDDLRLHPEKGNMKSYVYDIKDYRLKAILDEDNFASFFYYDVEGNLYLTKKETEAGIKTLSENINYIIER